MAQGESATGIDLTMFRADYVAARTFMRKFIEFEDTRGILRDLMNALTDSGCSPDHEEAIREWFRRADGCMVKAGKAIQAAKVAVEEAFAKRAAAVVTDPVEPSDEEVDDLDAMTQGMQGLDPTPGVLAAPDEEPEED